MEVSHAYDHHTIMYAYDHHTIMHFINGKLHRVVANIVHPLRKMF